MVKSGQLDIDALLGLSAWVQNPQTPARLTYSFMVYPSTDLTATDLYGLTQMTTAQKTATITALGSWANVANLSFSQVAETPGGSGGQIRLAANNQGSVSAGYTLLYRNFFTLTDAYLFLNTQSPTNDDFRNGSYGLYTLVHEIGHALGLKHPGDYNAGGDGGTPPYLPAATDTLDYTIMSYNNGTAQTSSYTYAAGPMLYDVQAIQYLYGPNMSYRTGNDTYRFGNTSLPQCIWDAGGTNTFDFSACTAETVINLNAGTFSQTRPGINNVSIAYGVEIQQALAGSGGSTIYCNELPNTITGGAGNDVIVNGPGASRVDGKGGINTFRVIATASDISTDLLANIQILDMNNQTVAMKPSQLLQFPSFINTSGGISFTENGEITVTMAVGRYLLSDAGPNTVVLPTLSASTIITGGAELDTVVFSGSVHDYRLTRTITGAHKVIASATNADLTVTSVERLKAADGNVALDLSEGGHAAEVVQVIGAAFGRDSLLPEYVGVGLELRDAGMTMGELCGLAVTTDLFRNLVGSGSNRDFVNLVYSNIVGVVPDEADLTYFAALLQGDGGTMTQAELLEYGARSEANQARINLVGLQATGVFYSEAT